MAQAGRLQCCLLPEASSPVRISWGVGECPMQWAVTYARFAMSITTGG